jgi:hypothetical protein
MSEDKNFESALNKAEELENIEFTNDTDFNINDFYGALEKIAIKNNNLKNEEAENIVTNNDYTSMIQEEFVQELESKRKRVEDFIRKYNPNTEEVKQFTFRDVEKVYAISNYLLNSYIQYVNEMRFSFVLTKPEYKFLNRALVREIEYNADEIFNFVELYDNFWKGVQVKVENEASADSYTVSADMKMILILHHLIKGYKVKGMVGEFKNFRSVLFKIAQMNKLFNAYNIIIERIKADRETWGAALDEIAKLTDPEYLKQMELQREEQGLKNVEIKEKSDALE